MKVSFHASLVILFCVFLCMVFFSGCTGFPPLKFNDTPPALITGVQTTVSPDRSAAAPEGSCAYGQIPCSGVCRSTLVDAGNCGRCGNVCSASQYCSNGVCTAGTTDVPVTGITTTPALAGSSCPTGYTPCSGFCRNLEFDANNCGRCGNACGSGRTCSSGACTGGSTTTAVTTVPAPLPDSAAAVTTTTNSELPACPSGTTRCGGSCIDEQTNNNNCGGCGNVCTGGRSCVSGVCRCPDSLTFCGGTCLDVNTDAGNCGRCYNACPPGYSCSAGTCVPPAPACPPATILCGMTCVTTETDNANCGACGLRCPAGTHCSGGVCTCDVGIPCAQSCVNTETDNNNCGGCGVTCYGDQTCVAGVCTAPIPAPCPKYQTACPFKGSVICVDLDTDKNNCGSCGNVCTSGICSGGTCSFVLK